MKRFGIYFLANDAVAPWAEGMLRSLRVKNPDLPVVHIPFDTAYDRINALRDELRFETLAAPLAEWDAMGARFFPDNIVAAHAFRKFAIFDGPFEEFFFLDSDLAVIDDLSMYAERVFDGAQNRICFYRRAHAARNFPEAAQHAALTALFPKWAPGGFNTALIAAKRDANFLAHVRRLSVQPHLPAMLGVAYEQPLLNFAAMTYGLEPVCLPQLAPELSVNWDGYLDFRWSQERMLVTGPDSPQATNEALHGPGGAVAGKRVAMIHWGGHRDPHGGIPNYDIWLAAQSGISQTSC